MSSRKQSAKTSTAIGKTVKGFTDEERAAMKERARELKAAARRGPPADEADGESAVLANRVLNFCALWKKQTTPPKKQGSARS
jgi:ATP-dependent DNA ligase